MSKYLIINADDFGSFRGANLAIFDLLKDPDSPLTSSTIMAPCPWAPEAVRFAKENPELCIGVHWTFTNEWSTYRWGPVAHQNTESLRDEFGYMHHESDEFEKHADLDEVYAEAKAQIELLKKLGLEPSHLDNHMGSIYGVATGRFELLNVAFRLAAEYGLPFRFPANLADEQFNNSMLDIQVDKKVVLGLLDKVVAAAEQSGTAIPDYLIPNEWSGPQNDSYDNFKEYIYELYKTFPDGAVTETYMHPCLPTEDLKGASGAWHRRVWEYELLKDPQTKQHIESLGLKLIDYRDLKKMKSGK